MIIDLNIIIKLKKKKQQFLTYVNLVINIILQNIVNVYLIKTMRYKYMPLDLHQKINLIIIILN